MVGRGARLYRLIKMIQQYRIDSEKRKRYYQELEWTALMENGDDYDENQLMTYIQAQGES